jgi:succinyl-diaminopimelate desuccinylase
MQQRLEDSLTRLVAIPSVSADIGKCQEIIDLMIKDFSSLGLHVQSGLSEDGRPWMLATTKQTQTVDILLAAHLDVVPGPDELFDIQARGERLYGRGVYDMKFAAACYLELFKEHATTLLEKPENIGVLFSTDEEIGGMTAAELLETGLRAKIVFLPDGGDNWSIERRAKGVYNIELISTGKSAHGSRPWEGENALHTILDVAQILRSKYPSDSPNGATLSINHISAGEAANQIPERASAKLDFRTFEAQELTDFKLLVTELARINDLEILPINIGDPLLFNESHPEVQLFLAVLKNFLGEDVTFCESYGASDARFFAPYHIPCIILEPQGGGRHARDEWIERADLEQYYRLIERWLLHSATVQPTEVALVTKAKNG